MFFGFFLRALRDSVVIFLFTLSKSEQSKMTSVVEKNGIRILDCGRLGAVVLLAIFVGAADLGLAHGQGADAQEEVVQEINVIEDVPADVETTDSTSAEEPGTDETVATEDDVAADEEVDGVAAAAELEAGGSGMRGLAILALLVALFVIPIVLGGYFAKKLKMPDHGWKFALALGTLAAAAVIVYDGEIKFGPDLSGGITLIYELQETALQEDGQQANGSSRQSKGAVIDQLIGALSERVDPSGTKEVTIRKYGANQIEIIIPKANPQDLEYIERRIYTAGALEFRITASRNNVGEREIIEQAERLPPGENEVWQGENKVAEWVPYSLEEFGPVDGGDSRLVKRMAGNVPQALVLTNDGMDVTGEYLSKATSGFDERGRPQVNFSFDAQGAFKFGQLTGSHVPTSSGQEYQLGILLDKKLLSAPTIQSKITDQGRITGVPDPKEVDFVVGILNAGSLPAQLNKEPLSRETISPTLGAETVRMGRNAIFWSVVVVLAFMIFYYRFAGMVACVALLANLLLILGLMVLFKAAFTLPGLAGLALTIGMAVDANVLIYERIREERARGAAMRMAIANGFDRATTTIIDSNLTTLITAIVIYKIAPDNVKGFGVTLIIGIAMSMYSAVYLSRLIFDIFERTRQLKDLRMRRIIGETHFDFLKAGPAATLVSLVLIAIGMVAVYSRGADMLDIDFTGGSSVTMVLKGDQTMPYTEVKQLLDETELKDQNLSLVAVGDKQNRYTISSVNQDVDAVQAILSEKFGDRLHTYQVAVQEILPIAASTEGESDPYAGGTTAKLDFSLDKESDEDSGVSYETVTQLVGDVLDATRHSGAAFVATNPDYQSGSARRFAQWDVKLALPEAEAQQVWDQLEKVTSDRPVFPLANKIGGRVAGDMQAKAIAAIVISLVGIVIYIWFRFHSLVYGIAASLALIHDVLVSVGAIAISAYLVESVPALANALMIEKFQISLTIVAALLTVVGYSINDTIVIFDRIREVKGKSPKLTPEMINTSVNQTLARTILTSLTVFMSVVMLYVFGGEGIHGFAFALVVGVLAGTYSTVFIACPTVLWLNRRWEAATVKHGAGDLTRLSSAGRR